MELCTKHIQFCVFATSAKIWAVLHLCRPPIDARNYIELLFNSMKTLKIVLEFGMYSLALEIEFKKGTKFISYLPIFKRNYSLHNVSRNTTLFF
jgi:hypothetical protein